MLPSEEVTGLFITTRSLFIAENKFLFQKWRHDISHPHLRIYTSNISEQPQEIPEQQLRQAGF
jgi:hypothetical protein